MTGGFVMVMWGRSKVTALVIRTHVYRSCEDLRLVGKTIHRDVIGWHNTPRKGPAWPMLIS